MDSSAYEGFDNSETGFYGVYNKAFSMLNYEEERTFKF